MAEVPRKKGAARYDSPFQISFLVPDCSLNIHSAITAVNNRAGFVDIV